MSKVKKFDAGDFLSLEQYLSACHAGGQQFCGTSFGNKLRFSSCEPAEYTYRLDYIPRDMGREAYLAQIEAAGWTCCGKVNGWQCLRRAGAEPPPEGAPLHNELDRGKWGRARAEREALLGILPMAVFYFAGCLLKDTAYANPLWKLATLFLIVAVAVVFPAYRVRAKCGQVMSQWYTKHSAPSGKAPLDPSQKT